ncbi:MAG: hypothetical protein O8C66_11165 [Candidatus Methanoperedens sp.]|nr:hypothetical protein [Candidatus Methanoperedens sp.]MCZ7371059.1 hypothetical protein [Candidatus Methanoperedens sp.]
MADVISNEEGQLMLLTVFLIVIGVVGYTSLLNNMIFTANMPSTGLDESKQDVRDFRLITESEILKAIDYSNISVADPDNQTQLKNYFLNYMNSYNDTVRKMYSARGASVEVVLNNVSFNKTASNITVNKYSITPENHTFSDRSLIIPMDDNQTHIMEAYGLVFKIADDTGSSGLSGIRIPVWSILQNPVNSSVPDFYIKLYTDDNASSTGVGNVTYRNYSGGPFLIEASDIDPTERQMILAEAKNKSVTVHELYESIIYNQSVKMIMAPRVAVYPSSDLGPMSDYYADGEIPYTALSDPDILNGNLTQYDILTIPHHNMASEPANVITAIVGWVANGGVLHAQCEATDTMDTAVENFAGSAKPWYGFIGISKSDHVPGDETYIRLLDNATAFNASYSFNTSPPMPLEGLADPGAPYSPLAQSNNTAGIFGETGGSTSAFSLRDNGSQVNPNTNILGIAVNATNAPVYADYDSDGVKEPQLMYVQAPYENGLVTYIAGHDLTKRTGAAERFIFETFLVASMRQQAVTSVIAKNINVTIKYYDGKVRYSDTFLVSD